MAIEDWPRAFQKYGVKFQLHNNFPNTPKPQGDLPNRIEAFYWHHDGTADGPSPGGLAWLIQAYNAGKPSAQITVSYDGTWNFCGAGIASHAGVVFSLPNQVTVGGETDHTTGERYPVDQLDSIRRGIAAAAIVEGRNSDWMVFHKTQAKPRGRKPDPSFGPESSNMDIWNAELARERGIIQNLINEFKSGGTSRPPFVPEWDEMATPEEIRAIVRSEVDRAVTSIKEGDDLSAHSLRTTAERIEQVRDSLGKKADEAKKATEVRLDGLQKS